MEAIPLEIWAQVLISVDVNSKLNLRCVNTHLFEIIDHRDFVIHFARSKQLPEIVKAFSRYNAISLTFTKTKKLNTKAINYLSKLTNLINLTFDEHEPLQKKGGAFSGLGRLTNLHSLNLPKVFINDNILYSMSNITHICIQSTKNFKTLERKTNLVSLDLGTLENFSLISKLEHLTYLKIESFVGESNDRLKDLDRLANLQSLFLSAPHKDFYLPYHLHPPIHTLTSLQSLQLQYVGHVELGNLTNLTKLALYDVNASKSDTQKWTTLTNLKSLHLRSFMVWRNARNNDDNYQFITALTNLCDFSVFMDGYFNLDFLRSDHLTSIRIDMNINKTHEKYRFRDMSQITRLTNLEKLVIRDDSPGDYNFMTVFSKLTQLEFTSSITEGKIETLTCVKHLTALKIFKVIYAGFKERALIPFDFADLHQLEELNLPYIIRESFESLKGITRLTSLTSKYGAQLTPETLEKLPLKVLHFQTHLQCDWSVVLRLTALESLAILIRDSDEQPQTKLLSLTELQRLTALQHLTALQVLDDHPIHIECFRDLTNLQKLECHGVKKLYKQLPFLYDYTIWKENEDQFYQERIY